MWACSGGREGKGCANIRTSPHGLVLVFEMRERERGGVRAPERATHRLVLVFETRERERGGARAPERAHMGTFWCSKRGRGRGNTRTCPQGHVLVFGMWGHAEHEKHAPQERVFRVRRMGDISG